MTFIPGSTRKVEQLIGDRDLELKQPTRLRTGERFGVHGTDLGASFEWQGKVVFLFGDTVGRRGSGGGDAIGVLEHGDPKTGLQLGFFTRPDDSTSYFPLAPPGITMKGFEVPAYGIDLNGKMLIGCKTNHTEDADTDRTVLVQFEPPDRMTVLREVSALPNGHFIKGTLHHQAGDTTGLPPGGPYIYMFGTGAYRKSNAYFAIAPAATFATAEASNQTQYFSGFANDTKSGPLPQFSNSETDAKPIIDTGLLGDLSLTFVPALNIWLMVYDSRNPRGIYARWAQTPYGPYSDAELLFTQDREGAKGKWIHDEKAGDDIVGPIIAKGKEPKDVPGGAYAPYVIERFTAVASSAPPYELTFYYVLSTWNPYVVVLMESKLALELHGK